MNKLTEQFCHRVHLIRVDKKLSQKDMADFLGISLSQYAKIERGETDIFKRAEQIGMVLKMNINLEFEEMPQDGGQPEAPIYYKIEKAFMEAIMSQFNNIQNEIDRLGIRIDGG